MRIEKTKVWSFFDEFVELVDKPSSVVDNHSSRRQITLPLKQPTRTLDGPSIEFLFGLATSGVYLAARCYQRHGVLLPHPFTLTVFTAVCSLLHWSWVSPQALPGTLPYGARTFLPSARLPRRGRRRSGDCLVSFGAQYRGFARPCHPALRIPIASVAAILREARQILS